MRSASAPPVPDNVKVTLAMLTLKGWSGETIDLKWGFAIIVRCQGDKGHHHHYYGYRTRPSKMYPNIGGETRIFQGYFAFLQYGVYPLRARVLFAGEERWYRDGWW